MTSDQKFHIWILVFIIIVLLITGCGYRVVKPDSKNSSPVIISVKPFKNKTLYPELDWRVTDFVIMELINWPWVKICQCDNPDVMISGEILSFQSQIPYTYDSAQDPLEYKLIIETSFSCQKKGKGPMTSSTSNKEDLIKDTEENLLVIPRLREEEIYYLGPYDLGDSKRAEREAMERAIKRMTRKAMDQFMGTNMSCY
ncbi:MAG: LPS assembly lipoprotein LptE [bacterium]